MPLHSNISNSQLSFYHPHIQRNATALRRPVGLADEDGVVEPSVGTVVRCLKFRGALEIKRWAALGIRAGGDDTAIADMDVHTIVGADGVDGFNFCAFSIDAAHLVVCTTIEDGSLDVGAFKGATRNGDDVAFATWSVTHGIHLAEGYTKLHHKVQLWSFFWCDCL